MKQAGSEEEKERILEEMNMRLGSIEEQLERERREQERQLEDILRKRQLRRVKKMAGETGKRVVEKEEAIGRLKEEIAREKASVYEEYGGVDGFLTEGTVKLLIEEVVEKAAVNGGLDMDEDDREQLEILRVQQKMEREQAVNAVEREIEDGTDIDRQRREEEWKRKLAEEREELQRKMGRAKNEKERKKLIQENKVREKKMEEEMEDERLRQGRELEEKRMNRGLRKKIRQMEMEKKGLGQVAEKEVTLIN